jgi:hypothetical protein
MRAYSISMEQEGNSPAATHILCRKSRSLFFRVCTENNTREERKWDKRPRRGVEALPLLMHSPIPAKLCVIQVKHCTKLNRILQCKWLLVYGVNKF